MSFLSQMLGMLPSAYNKADEYNAKNGLSMDTFIGRLFEVADWGFGLLHENAERVQLWADLDYAKGAVLDRHGGNWGVARGGADDTFYRLLIKIKILAQISGGDIETVISAVSGLYAIPADRVELYELFPAKVQIAIYEDDLPDSYMNVRDLVGILTKRLLAAGVGLDMVYKDEDTTGCTLRLGGRPVSEFTRVRLINRIEEIPTLVGTLSITGHNVSEFTRLRLESKEVEGGKWNG